MRQSESNRSWRHQLAILLSSALAITALAQSPDPARREELLRKYAGSYDTDALLNDARVRGQLERMLGAEMAHLQLNLDVKGAVDVIGGDLSVSGNAPHQGTEEEAVVCANTFNLAVSTAIFSNGIVTVYSREGQYEYLPLCVKDWITLVNSEHRDRMKQPTTVRMTDGQ